jgi:hypothetical protein
MKKFLFLSFLCFVLAQSVLGEPIPVTIAFQQPWYRAGLWYLNVTLVVHQDSDIERINRSGNWNGGHWTLRGDKGISPGRAEATIDGENVSVEMSDAKGKHHTIHLKVQSRAWILPPRPLLGN